MSGSALSGIFVGVGDLGRAHALYHEGLGLIELSRDLLQPDLASALWGISDPLEMRCLGRPDLPGSPEVRLVELPAPASGPRSSQTRPGPLGLGITARSIHQAHERLERLGVAFFSPPIELTPEAAETSGPRRFEAFGRAPDGEQVVLIERRNAPLPYGTFSDRSGTSEPLHTSHVVTDLAAAGRFMSEVLEHRMLFRERCAGPDFERLMALPPGTGFDFEMLGHPDFDTGRIIFIQFEGEAEDPFSVGRGLAALRYRVADLESLLRRAEGAGACLLHGPRPSWDPLLGEGRWAVVRPPFLTPLFLWQSAARGER